MAFFAALETSPALFVTTSVLLGLVAGSFLNVVIHRLPKMVEREWQEDCASLRGEELPPAPAYNLVVPRSACPSCGHRITALENVPVASYLALRGRCRACKAPIGVRYPLIEVLTGAITGFIAWRFGYTLAAAGAMLFCWALIALAAIDLDTMYLPDAITLPLAWIGLLFNLNGTFRDLGSAVIGAVGGYLVLWSVYWGFKLIARKEGMGYGDFKLLAAIGAWLGWQMLPLVVLASSLVGAVVGGTAILLQGRDRNTQFPFGPYLMVAAVIALFWGAQINRYYLQIL